MNDQKKHNGAFFALGEALSAVDILSDDHEVFRVEGKTWIVLDAADTKALADHIEEAAPLPARRALARLLRAISALDSADHALINPEHPLGQAADEAERVLEDR